MSPPAFLRMAIDRDPAVIADAAERIAAFSRGQGCPEAGSFRLQVGVAELLNNLYEHAGAVPSGSAPWVTVRVQVRPGRVRLLFIERDAPLLALPAGRLPDWQEESGRGLFILEQWFTTFRRRNWRSCACWHLTLQF